MKNSRLFLALLLALAAGCDRGAAPADQSAQRQADERRIAELRDLEQRAADREAAARTAQIDADRAKIDAERAALEREKADLTDAQREAKTARLAQLREDERRLEQRRADEKAAAAQAKKEAAQDARTAQKIDFFYEPLDPLGDWFELEKYGYVWQPREAQNQRWRPYTDGSWVWTDYGWTWASNEKFGWATYHYGRWTRVKRIGWVWVPGSEWAPAWVAWRRSDSFVGWAPLPPDAHSGSGFTAAVDSYYDIGPTSYAFVPVENFGEPTYVGRVAEPEQNVTILNTTVNVTNVTYKTVQNQTAIFNAGPEIAVIDARSRTPVKQLRVEKVSDRSGIGPAAQRGNVLQLAAPIVAASARPAAAPAKVKERVKSNEVEHGWNGVADPQAARAKLAQEAHTAEQAQRAPATRPVAAPVAKPIAAPTAQPVAPDNSAAVAAQRKAEMEKAAEAKRTADEQRKADAAKKAEDDAAAKVEMKKKTDEQHAAAQAEKAAAATPRPAPPTPASATPAMRRPVDEKIKLAPPKTSEPAAVNPPPVPDALPVRPDAQGNVPPKRLPPRVPPTRPAKEPSKIQIPAATPAPERPPARREPAATMPRSVENILAPPPAQPEPAPATAPVPSAATPSTPGRGRDKNPRPTPAAQ